MLATAGLEQLYGISHETAQALGRAMMAAEARDPDAADYKWQIEFEAEWLQAHGEIKAAAKAQECLIFHKEFESR